MMVTKKSLSSYINSLPTKQAKESFATRCITSLGYLRLVASGVRQCSATLAIAIDRESQGQVRCDDLCPDADFDYLRAKPTQEHINQ
ncbi:transcriptional regulator [Acinetobacter sp. Ag2]|uniref:transcriptional regulator n=1 Tax=Acinetobacter sp. Ag2 TaxID=1646532 RepID=UPI000629222C|nr:transcriptional regulator [Acinetobacter sp. Ag2]KKW76126.1 transcriptional regulator [Acinetobacter sp. Ag2]